MPICRYGASSVFEQSNELPTPSVNRNEVLVKIKSTSVNPIDLMKREGYGKTIFEKQRKQLFPWILGSDVSGIVKEVGSKVTKFKEGDEVYGSSSSTNSGTYCEYAAFNQNEIDNHIPLKHREKNIARYKLIPEGGRMPEDKLPSELYRKNFGNTFKRLDRQEPAFTMVPGHNAFPIHPTENRSLTVREAARIQTFPDNIIFPGTRQSQCIQVGNAVPPKLAKVLALHLLKLLDENQE